MWILPKNLITSPFVQDTAELILDLQEFCQTCEPSLTVRSNFTQSKTLLTKWKKESSRPLLYGQTLKLSHSSNFEDTWISYLADSHVNLFQALEKEAVTPIQDTYSHLSNKESLSQDLPLFSWKMFEVSSAQNSNQTNGMTPKIHRFCYMSLESWKELVTSVTGAYSQREKQASPILGNESLSWEKEQILQLLGLKSFPSTFKTVVKQSYSHATGKALVYANQQMSMIREDMGHTTQPSYYKRLLSQLLALKESNPQAFARLAVEIESNNSLNRLELLGKTWKTPTKSDALDASMTTPIKEHAIIDRADAKISRQVHLEAMNEQIKTWATPATNEAQMTMTPSQIIDRQVKMIDSGDRKDKKQMQLTHQVTMNEWNTLEQIKTWATPMESIATRSSYPLQMNTLANRMDNNRQLDLGMQVHIKTMIEKQMDAIDIQAPKSDKLTFTELRMMREQALAKPESERTQEEINLLNYREMLNPRWVEMLMGLPIGWTMKNCATAIQVSWMK